MTKILHAHICEVEGINSYKEKRINCKPGYNCEDKIGKNITQYFKKPSILRKSQRQRIIGHDLFWNRKGTKKSTHTYFHGQRNQ